MANKINLEELPQLTVGEMVDLLSMSFVSLVRSKLPFSSFPSVMLWGQPGVGKSQGVRQIAAEIEKETQKKVVVTDVRLLLFNPIDLRGIPVANEERTLAVWLKPKIFAMDSSDDVVNILFLDEISAAPQSVQAAAYQITLDRAVGEHKLPDNCIVMAAGNRTSDKSVANKMPKALANRLLHLEIKTSFKAWRDWAFRKKVNPMVIGFLSWKNSYLNTFDPSKDELAFATPRSYEMLSNLLWVNKDKDVEDLFPLISGLIGTGIASEFVTWCKTYKDLPKPKDIFDGKNIEAPKEVSQLHALVSSLVSYFADHYDEDERVVNSIKFAQKLPADFSVLMLNEYVLLDETIMKRLMTTPDFTRWVAMYGKLLNGKRQY